MSAHRDRGLWAYCTVAVLCFTLCFSGLAIPAFAAPEGNHSIPPGDSAQLTEPYEVPIPVLVSPQTPPEGGTSPVLSSAATAPSASPAVNETVPISALSGSLATHQQTSEGMSRPTVSVTDTTPVSEMQSGSHIFYVTQPPMGNESFAALQLPNSGGGGYIPLTGLSSGVALVTLVLIRYWALVYDDTLHVSDTVEDGAPPGTTYAIIDPLDSHS
ncbi:MAG: hypothetical protein LUP95_01200 [Euryarchaeota archaeon]|nr:hypothetical protein [Euryarchaeota archaeon]